MNGPTDDLPDPEHVPEHPVIEVIDSADSDFELPDINLPQQLPLHVPHAELREAVVLSHRLLVTPPRSQMTLPHVIEQEVDWEALEGELVIIDAVPPPPPVQPHIDWAILAYALMMLGNAQQPE